MSHNPERYGRLIVGDDVYLCDDCLEDRHLLGCDLFLMEPFGWICCGCEICRSTDEYDEGERP